MLPKNTSKYELLEAEEPVQIAEVEVITSYQLQVRTQGRSLQ